MPWYRVDFYFGPGGQSHDAAYVWRDMPVGAKGSATRREFIENVWESEFTHYQFTERVSGECELVQRLPEDVFDSLVRREEWKIAWANKRLALLRNRRKTLVDRKSRSRT